MGAQIIGSVYNAKQLTIDILNAMLLSMGGAGAIAFVLDVGMWPGVIALISLSGCHFCAHVVGVFLYSLTPLVAETFDSLVIKRLLISLEGGNFMFATLDKFIDNLKDAFTAGKIAAGGSIMNNILAMEEISKKLGLSELAPNLLTNQVKILLLFENV